MVPELKKLIEEAGIDPDLINDDKLSTTRPPWKLNNPTINLTLSKLQKNDTIPSVYKTHLNKLLEQYVNFTQIYTDGSKSEEKVAAAAVANKGKTTHQCRLLDDSSIFTAELRAITVALKETFQSKKNPLS